MIVAQDFISCLEHHGISFFSGVPCSFLKEPMSVLAQQQNYVAATIESEAIAIAAGSWLAGQKTAVFCQNSGLGNLVNALSSLNATFHIPCLLILGWRGAPGTEDEPQHQLMGETTKAMLELMQVPSIELPQDPERLESTITQAFSLMELNRRPVALLVHPGTFETASQSREIKTRPVFTPAQSAPATANSAPPTRFGTLEKLVTCLPEDAAIIATTGKCGRELFTIADRPQHFYMVGSMGSASAIGLGIALSQPKRPVVVLDGDGAALMRLGTFATIGREAPGNLLHIILDNGTNDSTGGQATGSDFVDFPSIAAACQYRAAISLGSLDTLVDAARKSLSENGPHLLHMRIAPGSRKKLGRPTIPPPDVAARFANFLTQKIQVC